MASKDPGKYSVQYLGWSTLSNMSTGLGVIQAPLLNLYVSFFTAKGSRRLPLSRLTLTDRGLIVTKDNDDTFYSMPSILLGKPVQLITTKTKDKNHMYAFEPITSSNGPSSSNLFTTLDKQYKYLSKLRHPPLVIFLLRRTTGLRAIDVHAFVCESHMQATDIAGWIGQAQQNYCSDETQESDIFDYNPFVSQRDISVGGGVGGGGGGGGNRGARQQEKPGGGKQQRPITMCINSDGSQNIMRSKVDTGRDRSANVARHQSVVGAVGARESRVFLLTQDDICKPSDNNDPGGMGMRIYDIPQLYYPDEMVAASDEPRQPKPVQRAKTFQESGHGHGPQLNIMSLLTTEDSSRAVNKQTRAPSPAPVPPVKNQYNNNNNNKFYENLPASNNSFPKPTEKSNSTKSSSRLENSSELGGSANNLFQSDNKMSFLAANLNNNRPHDSLRMAMADAKGPRRPTVLASKDTSPGENPYSRIRTESEKSQPPLSMVSEKNSPAPTPRQSVLVQPVKPMQQNMSSSNEGKPVAMVQPRKVQGIKVLPSDLEAASIPVGAKGSRDVYNFEHSKHAHSYPDIVDAKPGQTPNKSRPEVSKVDPVKTDLSKTDLVKQSFSEDIDKPANKNTSVSASASNVDLYSRAAKLKMAANSTPPVAPEKSTPPPTAVGGSSVNASAAYAGFGKAAEKPVEGKDRKDAEIASMVQVLQFNKPNEQTLSAHGTNFEKSLGYFP